MRSRPHCKPNGGLEVGFLSWAAGRRVAVPDGLDPRGMIIFRWSPLSLQCDEKSRHRYAGGSWRRVQIVGRRPSAFLSGF